MHCKKWISVYYMPQKPAFLGSCTTSLNDSLIQGTRWTAGLIEVALSRFSPIIYGPSRMSVLHSFCYAWLACFPFAFLPLWILATIPQLALLNDVTVYPEVRETKEFPTIFDIPLYFTRISYMYMSSSFLDNLSLLIFRLKAHSSLSFCMCLYYQIYNT